ncbi:hypothetical protein BCY91_00455 [Pelobium manganitolerans]|uniref:Peptidyl-prolyl cis-trans isomerase n=1 Tax=Pelobium manganitolerans TaxID=1842495 RepID=A0A419SCB2_9SPHI|nr:hypothetical protein BCY91_00455 [Pelobium manganitolerans]
MPGNTILDTKLNLIDDTDRPVYEDALIQDYLAENKLTATKDGNGIYYNIVTPGTGTEITSADARVEVAYKGKLLTNTVFDEASTSSPVTLTLSNTIKGWQLALPKIKAGGKINLYIPSRFAYGSTPPTGIPANAILAFEISVISVTN